MPDPSSSDKQWAGAVLAMVSLGCVAVLAATLRWSLWWPHSDMRQNFAALVTVLAAVVGFATFLVARLALPNKGRLVLGPFVALAVLLGAIVGFEVLKAATEVYR